MIEKFFKNLTIERQNNLMTSFVLSLSLIYMYIISNILELNNNLIFCKLFIILFLISSMLNFSLSVLLFKENNNLIKKLLIKMFLTMSVMSLSIPIMNYELKQELNNERKIEFNKNLQTILDISKENIYENLSTTDKEKFKNNVSFIKEKFKSQILPLTGEDLNITKNVLYELKKLKEISNSKEITKSIEKDTKELIKNIN